ncbi:MAG: tetratricopeptide repeat protein [Anaerolineae bacterium]
MVDLTLRGQTEEAVRLMRAGRLHEAVDQCQRMLRSFPLYIGAYAILGQTSLKLDDVDAAQNLFQRVLGADPESDTAFAGLATIYEQWGQEDDALWHWERALELYPNSGEIRHNVLRLRQECTGKGASESGRPARIEMTRAALARAYLRGQIFFKATAELRDLLRSQPLRWDLWVALAESLWRDHQDDEAVQVCETILAELPDCLKANLILGQAWLNTSRQEAGRELLRKAQALEPENATAQSLFGARSPLPPRTPRVPLGHSDAAPLDLPYLLVDDEAPSEPRVIEGRPTQATSLPWTPRLAAPDVAAIEEEAGTPMQTRAGGWSPMGQESEDLLSLIDVRLRYLQEHPEDHFARLELARHYRDGGKIDHAAVQYRHLIQNDFTTLSRVIHDLERLNRLYPGTPALIAALKLANERDSRSSPRAHRV